MHTRRLFWPVLTALIGFLVLCSAVQASPLNMLGPSTPTDPGWTFKAGGWVDYAPSGVPDFDQKQPPWDNPQGSSQWTFCGPVAAANSLWWFDSKLEPSPIPPPAPSDNYYLVTSYQGFGLDDHDPSNVGALGPPGLVDDLAWYFDTDGIRSASPLKTGTEVHSMSLGLQWYLYGYHPAYPQWHSPYPSPRGSYYDDYHVQLVKMPTFPWVVEEVQRSEDVILLLGFWHDIDESPANEEWKRLGGHYVTVAGVNPTTKQIALSDPFLDNAEAGGPGRVLSGTITPHQPLPGHPASVHNDAGNVSHDFYTVTLDVSSPAGVWEIEGYPYDPAFVTSNCPAEFLPYACDPTDPVAPPIYVEVEYALTMSPFYWKPGGEWVFQEWNDQWIWEWWWYEDDGDSCMPDFWWGMDLTWEGYDGPTALANSLWWFDSKAETLKTAGFPTPPPAASDHYSLVVAYGPYDDHDPQNTVGLVSMLASPSYLDTRPTGTSVASMTAGIDAWMEDAVAARDFYTQAMPSPDFDWIADEVETCEDVLMLLGFYEHMPDGTFERKGGHWVNAAGVGRHGGLLGLSDPALNHAVSDSISTTLYLGRVFPPDHLGTPFSAAEQQHPQSISHDIYHVLTGTLPTTHSTALVDYPAESVITSFIQLNGGGAVWTGQPISTAIDWAIGVSPYSDLVITKTAAVTVGTPGQPITYVLEYANWGLAAAESVTLTDHLPTNQLANITYTSKPRLQHTPGYTYEWTLPKLTYGQSGTITLTAQSVVTALLHNTATITGLNAIGQPTPDRDPDNNTSITGTGHLVFLPLILRSA
jgi:uncharacterized repeat protein (TIGR01451 family)